MVNALIARMITAEEMGAYFLLFSVISVGVLMASLGMQVATVRLVAQAMAKGLPGIARATVVMVLRIGIASAVLITVAIGVGGDVFAYHVFNVPEIADVKWFAAVFTFNLVLLNLMAESFRGFHAFGLAAIFSNNTITNVSMVVLLTASMFIYADADLKLVLTNSVISSVLGVALAAFVMRRRLAALGDATQVTVKSVLNVSLPLMMSGVTLFVLTQADLWIIGMFASSQDVAVYGAAIRMSQLIFMPLLIGNTMLAPFIAELYTQGESAKLENVIRSVSTISVAFALVMLTIFVVAGDSILALAFGEYYRNAHLLLVIISAGQCVNVWCGPNVVTLINTGHQKSVMYVSLTFGALIVVGSVMVVESLGARGVASIMGVVVAAQAVYTLCLVKRKTGMRTYAGLQYVSFLWKKIRL